jgi:tetratricopeptide (TPR) repeat protein
VEAIRTEETELAARVLADFPQSSDAMALLAVLHGDRGNVSEAMRYWEKALEIYPQRVDAYNSMGKLAKLAGEDERAVALWSKALEIAPAHAEVRERLTRALIDLGRPDEAAAVMERALEQGPPTSMSRHLLGLAYQQLDKLDEAKRNYLAAAAIEPAFAECYYGLATVCQRLSEADEAREYREQFRQLKAEELKLRTDPDIVPDDVARAREGLARTYTSAGRIYLAHQRATTAVQCWEKAAALDANSALCRTELAQWHRQQDRVEEALHWFAEVARIEPENVKTHLLLGALNAQAGRLDAAERAFQEVLRLQPRQPEACWGLAQVYLGANRNLAEAKTLAATAVQSRPSAMNYYVLSAACVKNGDFDGALAAAKRAVELDPQNARYRQAYEQLQKRQ